MGLARYNLIPGDWHYLEQIINDLSTQVLTQGLTVSDSPEFTTFTLSGLTATRLVATDGDKVLVSTDANSWIAGTANQITVTDDADGTVTLSAPQDLAVASSPTFSGLTINGYTLIDQDTNAAGLAITSDATTYTNWGLSVTTGSGAIAALIAYGAEANGAAYLGCNPNGGYGGSFQFVRDLAAASTDCSVLYVFQDNAGDDQPALEIRQDGTGPALRIVSGGVDITGTVTLTGNITISDDGYIGSVSDTDAIQIAASGNVTISQTLYVSGDIELTGNLNLTDDAGIGVNNNPMIVFDETDHQVEVTGTLTVSGINANAATPQTRIANTELHIAGTDSTVIRVLLDAYNEVPSMTFRRAAGTAETPTAVQDDECIGELSFHGYGATGYSGNGQAHFCAYAAQNWTDAAQGTYLTFETCPVDSIAEVEVMRIDSTGYVGINETAPDTCLEISGAHVSGIGLLHLNSTSHCYMLFDAAAASEGGFLWAVDGTSAWQFRCDGNNGDIFDIRSREVGGDVTRFSITQAGVITLAGTVASYTMAGNITMPDGGTIGQVAGPLLTFDDTNDYLEISGCNVGINETAPQVPLHVSRSGGGEIARFEAITSGDSFYRFRAGTCDVYTFVNRDSSGGVGTITAHPFTFRTGNTDKLWLSVTGQFGIGLSPSYWLHLEKTGSSTDPLVYIKAISNKCLMRLDAVDTAHYEINTTNNRNWSVGAGWHIANLFEIRDATANSLRVGINASGVLKAYYGAHVGDGGTTNSMQYRAVKKVCPGH